MKPEIHELGTFLGATLAALAPAVLLAEIVDFLGGPDADSRIVRLVTISSAILVGTLFSLANRDVRSMSADELTEVTRQARVRARWWEVALAGAITGSWAYVLLVVGGRTLGHLGLVSFSLSAPLIASFAAASLIAAVGGAMWWSAQPKDSS